MDIGYFIYFLHLFFLGIFFFLTLFCNPERILNYLALSSLPKSWACNPNRDGTIMRLAQKLRGALFAEFVGSELRITSAFL